jgi:copper chaperone CopZ
MNRNTDKKLIGAGVVAAIAASLCCITPVLAFLSGAAGLASAFSWMEPARPWLIALTIGVLGFAWFQKFKPRKAEDTQCACDENGKTPFLQTRTFLALVTVFAAAMMAFPYYGSIFYSNDTVQAAAVPSDQVETASFEVSGMTCTSCEDHVRHEVSGLKGVVDVTADYNTGKVAVRFDRNKLSADEIRQAIDATGYKVKGTEEVK